MDQKLLFVSDFVRKGMNFSDLCRLYNISRKTGYKWISRYKELGVQGLQARSSRPHHMPFRVPLVIQKKLIELRHQFHWGPKKLLSLIAKSHPTWHLPSLSTAHEILRKEGLVKKRQRHRYSWEKKMPLVKAKHPNIVWTADFKGQFRMGNYHFCYPLTVADAYSRFLLGCRALPGTKHKPVIAVFRDLFERFGLPDRIRTDNGVPFASIGAGGLSHLSIWWIRLGIFPERIRPGRPQENGQHERMHRTIKEYINRKPVSHMAAQQRYFDELKEEYNKKRPHEALNNRVPADCYKKSKKALSRKTPEIEYPAHYMVRLVNHNGCIVWRNKYVYTNSNLKGNFVGLNQLTDEDWALYYGPVKLGHFNEREIKKTDYIKLKNVRNV